MSTDHQQYSTENQQAAIRQFAAARGITVIRSFIDAGKSGVGIHGRDSLQELLRVVESDHADFSTILVYDISRWGRFQQPDEGAYYEFRCIRANITVQYCAEQFPSDNAPMSAVLKSLKRAMAGEYSRELSAKVFAGQCRLINLGFRQGGPPGYGLRRQLLDQNGRPKAMLNRGERKSFQLERVILVPGPANEQSTVRRIFSLFVETRLSENQIASLLNAEGIFPEAEHPWTRGRVHEILTNEKYIGHNVYNRTSGKLQKPRTTNDPDAWIRCLNAFSPIVDPAQYLSAQAFISARDHHFTNDELLQLLRKILERHGRLSGLIISEYPDGPSPSTYTYRFKSLRRAYELIGYTPARDYSFLAISRWIRTFHREQVDQIAATLEALGVEVERDRVTGILTINGGLTVSITTSRCRTSPKGESRWKICFDSSLDPDITIAARMAPDNSAILDYYVFPSIDVISPQQNLAEVNSMVLDVYRAESLTGFFNLFRVQRSSEAA